MDSCTAVYGLLNTEGREKELAGTQGEVRDLIQRITRCMDLSEIPEFRRDNAAKEAAVALKEILDRIVAARRRGVETGP